MPIRNWFGDDVTEEPTWITPDETTTGKILGYFGRTTDRAQIRNAVLQRYGTRVKSTKSPTGTVRETYVVGSMADQIDAGHIEIVSSGFGPTLSATVANLFTQPGLKFSLTPQTEGADCKDAAEFLEESRESSQFLDGLVQVDKESFQIGCGVLWLEFYESLVRYKTIDPGKIQACFGTTVDSEEGTRPVNYNDIEDAMCVILETGQIDETVKSFVAIYGRSPGYPLGRYVTYRAEGDGREVPAFGTEGTHDWLAPGTNTPANPLSFYADENPDILTPEYPLAIFYGGHVRRDQLFPVSTTILEESLEADVTASHLRGVSNDNARGARVIERTQAAAGKPLPANVYGPVALEPGQTLKAVDSDPSGAEVAWGLLREGNVTTAQGYGVPDFYTSREEGLISASGVALKIRATPLVRFRGERVSINRPAVDKAWAIEKALILMFSDDPRADDLVNCDQTWEPGVLDFPEDPSVVVANVTALVEMGVYDTIEAIQTIYHLPTEMDAVEKYQALVTRAKKYPPLNALPAADGGDEGDGENLETGATGIKT